MVTCEWRIRFFLVLHHLDPTTAASFDFFCIEQALRVEMRGTHKLTFLYFCDKLLSNFRE
jgi:hypothetical protein